MPEDYKDFGKKIKELRLEKNWTLRKLAEETGMHYAYLSHVERGKEAPGIERIKKLANVLGYQDVEELIFLAEKIPKDITQIFKDNPTEAAKYLRKYFKKD